MNVYSLVPRWRWCVTVTCCIASLASCAVGPDFEKPTNALSSVELSPRPDYGDELLTSASELPSQWWSLFNDPLLSDLQSRAQLSNLDLQVASSRIDQSRAQLGVVSSLSKPNLSAGAGFSREALSENGKLSALGAPSSPSEFWQLGFDASWELDLWGRARRSTEAAEAALKATQYDLEATRVSLSAEIARTYLLLRGTQAQLLVTAENLVVHERALTLAESRERHGVASRFDTASARAQLATIKAQVPEFTQRRNVQMNALALLLDEPPRTLDSKLREAAPIPTFPTQVPVGLSSELARRRPDILRAESQLHAATASIGTAKADFYPRIGLKGRIGVEAFEYRDLDSWDSRFFSIGPTVYLPIFQGGRLTQQLALSEAREKTAALAYRQTVLHAWHEVDNALDAWAAQKIQHKELQASLTQSEEALRIAERGYAEGASDYLYVLSAQRALLSAQAKLNSSYTSGALTLVNLYKSLGGGWDPGS